MAKGITVLYLTGTGMLDDF